MLYGNEEFEMKIEVWSDFACPFCYIGKRQLEQALTQFKYADKVIIEYKSYEILPDTAKGSEKNIHEVLADKANITVDQAIVMNNDLKEQALAVGLQYETNNIKHANTFDAHRLVKYAFKQHKGHEMTERLLRAYFTEGANIGNHKTLVQLAISIGLDETKVKEILQSNAYETKVRCDQIEAQQIGAQVVPFFVFDERYSVSGAQSPEVFLEVLERVWEELSEKRDFNVKSSRNSETTYCIGECCDKQDDTIFEEK